jgi:hypothetical protein
MVTVAATAVSLASLLSVREKRFSSERSADAQVFGQQQRQLWTTLLDSLPNIGNPSQTIREKILQAVTQTTAFQRTQEDDEIVLAANIPFLTQEIVRQVVEIAKGNAMAVWAALAVECRNIVGEIPVQLLSWNFITQVLSYLTGGVSPKDFTSIVESLNTAIYNLNVQTNTAKTEIESAQESADHKTKAFVDEKKAELASFMVSLSEDIKLKSSSSLWANRAGWYRFGTAAWFAVFVLLASSVIVYFMEHVSDFVKDLPKDSSGNIPYASIVLILIPALGAAWLLRLISRFLNNNHVLADDARHRQVMTQTYLALVADNKSEVTDKDRLVMLSAIFRPLPGAQIEEVAPPSILDLLKKPE